MGTRESVRSPESGVGRDTRERRRGQGTLEYILVIAAVIAAIIAVVSTTMRPAVEKTLTDSQTVIERASDRLVEDTVGTE